MAPWGEEGCRGLRPDDADTGGKGWVDRKIWVEAGVKRTVSCINNLGCSTWKCLWTKGLGRWWTLKMSFCPSFPSSSTSIMESMRESTADSCVSKRRDNQHLYLHLPLRSDDFSVKEHTPAGKVNQVKMLL